MNRSYIVANGKKHAVIDFDDHNLLGECVHCDGWTMVVLPITIWLAHDSSIAECGVGTRIRLYLDSDSFLSVGHTTEVERREGNAIFVEFIGDLWKDE